VESLAQLGARFLFLPIPYILRLLHISSFRSKPTTSARLSSSASAETEDDSS
uniref:Uncharacterized protein n=1 Tax=Aegilops tauschii subsp. strangulata TaxID=200361 RepID=A0A453NHC9_AEGTS